MVKIAIFGLGGVAEQIHLPACSLLPNVNVVAACEPDNDRRDRMGRRFGIPELYSDPATLLEREKPDIVIVATPPDQHRDLCILALDSGAHVFCEKPFVKSLAEADEVIETAERRRRSVFVNNQYRFMKIYRVAQERIASGEYGKPFLIQCWQQMFHPPSEETNWRSRLVQSTLYEFGTHPLDLLCFFFNDFPLSINAHTPRSCPAIEADVIVQATLRFPGDGLATLIFNRISHAPERYLEMRVDCEQASFRISFGGMARAALDWSRPLGRPTLRFSLVKGGEARLEKGGRSRVIAWQWREGRTRATAIHLKSLIELVKGGKVSNDQARHAREILRIVFAGYESARRGETVWLQNPPAPNTLTERAREERKVTAALNKPRLSVVVASHNARSTIEECLATLQTQLDDGMEMIVVDNSTDGTSDIIRERFPNIKLMTRSSSDLIPHLWEAGIRQSRGDIVAITTAHFVPHEDWILRILEAHANPVPAIGGAIENDESAGMVDWAVYFCRYSKYMLPFKRSFVREIAGDNASYKRQSIDPYEHVWRNGFWEPAVHTELEKAGLRLLLVPSIVLYHKRSFSFWEFMKQRFQHGRQFGRWRSTSLTKPKRVFHIASSPMLPFLLLFRNVRQVWAKGKHRKKLLASLPIQGMFFLAWTLGEGMGYLEGSRG